MEKIILWSIVVILGISSLFGCNSGQTDQANFPKPSVSDAGNTGKLPPKPDLLEGKPIAVQGKDTGFSLHCINFIDADNGWLVEDNQSGSRLLMTRDGGARWEKTKLDNMEIKQLVFIDKVTGWAVAQTKNEAAAGVKPYTVKILHTEDSGKSWKTQWSAMKESDSDCELWFQDVKYGYALVNGTLLSTGNGGADWQAVSSGLNNFTPEHMSFVDADRGWVIGRIEKKYYSGASGKDVKEEYGIEVLGTLDGCKHWQSQFEKVYPDGIAGSIDIDFVDASAGWFLTSDASTMTGDLYYTSDGGKNWGVINQLRSARPSPKELSFITPEIGWIPLDIGAGPIDGGLMFTRDGGKTFDTLDNYGEMNSMHEVDFTSGQQGWALGTSLSHGDYLIHTADGGKTWTQVYPELRPVEDISFIDNQHGFGLGQLSDSGALLCTADGGNTWKRICSFTEDFACSPVRLSFIDCYTGWVLAVSRESGEGFMLRTLDGGKTWKRLDGNLSQVKGVYSAYLRFFDSNKGILVSSYATGNAFCKTIDGGRTWQISEQPSLKGADQFSFVSQTQGWRINSSGDANIVKLSKTEEGSSWKNSELIGMDMRPCGIEFISEERGWVLVEEPAYKSGSRKKLLATDDGGRTWYSHIFPSGLELETLKNQIPMQFADDRNGWILTTDRLLKTQDGGETWK